MIVVGYAQNVLKMRSFCCVDDRELLKVLSIGKQ